jgi:hypothetical protein
MPRPAPRRAAPAVLAALCLAIPACQFDKVAVAAPRREQLVVHAVLNPRAGEVVILVERLLSGRVPVDRKAPFDPGDPVASGAGDPVTGATVVLYAESGDSAYALENATPPVAGAVRADGVYHIGNGPEVQPTLSNPNPPDIRIPIGRGARYRLRVTTADGFTTVTGVTTVPDALPANPDPAIVFNRDQDTLALQWTGGPATRRYAVRVDTPYGLFFLFTDSTSVHLRGTLQNLFAEGFPRAFQPGFDETVSVAAVDGNFFDYYRSRNSPFTGSGLINHLTGGIGLFGSYVPLRTRPLAVTGTRTQPVEGRYTSTAPGAPVLDIWVESRDGGVTRLTGKVTLQGTRGLLGRLAGSRLSLVVLSGWSATDTASVHPGTFAGDSIVLSGVFQGQPPTVFHKT